MSIYCVRARFVCWMLLGFVSSPEQLFRISLYHINSLYVKMIVYKNILNGNSTSLKSDIYKKVWLRYTRNVSNKHLFCIIAYFVVTSSISTCRIAPTRLFILNLIRIPGLLFTHTFNIDLVSTGALKFEKYRWIYK
jgi:hypothetical protein